MKIAAGVVVCVLLLAGCGGSGGGDSSGNTNVSLRVESDGSTADITYGAGGSTSQANASSVPWIQTVNVSKRTAKAAGLITIVAQADSGASYISCEVVIGTKTVSKNRSTGAYSVVTC